MENKIYKNVKLGDSPCLACPVIIGNPPLGKKEGELETRIGDFCIIRPFTTIYAGVVIGHNFQTGQCASIREDNEIGDNVSIGSCSTIEFGNRVGDNSRIHSGCFLEMTTIGNYVFIGPNTVFTDDPHPMKCPKYKDCKKGGIVGDYAKIGANVTVLPGVRIGKNALIGAGTLVSKDVPENVVFYGNPGKVRGKVSDLTCEPGFFERPYIWEPYIKK